MALAAAVASVLMHVFIHTTLPLHALVFFGGGITWGIYTAGLALLGGRFKADGMAAANAAFVLICELGILSGASLSGAAMTLMGAVGFPVVASGAMLLVALVAPWHGRAPYKAARLSSSVPEPERDFQAVSA